MTSLEKDRWYYFEIFPRDLEKPQFSFRGSMLVEKGDEYLIRNGSGRLYYLRYPTEIEIKKDRAFVRAEWVESGKSIAEILKQVEEIYGREQIPDCPLLQDINLVLEEIIKSA